MSLPASVGHWASGHQEAAIAVVGLAVTVGLWFLDHRKQSRLIGWRMHMNAAISFPVEMAELGDVVVRTGKGDVADPSLVLIRFENTGRVPLVPQDFDAPIRVNFGRRQVEGVQVLELKPDELKYTLAPGSTPGVTVKRHEVEIPPLTLNVGDRFKLLTLLSGRPEPNDIRVGAHLQHNGDLKQETGGPGLSKKNVAYGAITLTLLGALAAALIVTVPRTTVKSAVQCVAGSITIDGSTAFQPAMTEVARDYEHACAGATVTINGNGSIAGINELASGSIGAAMYDGSVPADAYPRLHGTPIAVVVFAVVVNSQTGIHNLSVPQLQQIFALHYRSWDQVGGTRQPITIVARDSQSGTRNTFRQKILADAGEPGPNSQDCLTPNSGQSSAVLVCEMNSTGTLLQEVNKIPGAIGYAELAASETYPDVNRIQIDGNDPGLLQETHQVYPFWATEHIYTTGSPAAWSLLAAFLGYLTSDTAKNVMDTDSDIPCADLHPEQTQTLCPN